MSDQKNIDNLFREAFKDFEATPDPALWDKISSQLDEKTPPLKKRKEGIVFLPWFYKIAGIAAALLLLFAVGSQFFDNGEKIIDPTNETTSTTNENTNSNSTTTNSSTNGTASDTQVTGIKNSTEEQHLQNENDSQNTVLSEKERIANESKFNNNSNSEKDAQKNLEKGNALQNAVVTQDNGTNSNTVSQQSLNTKNGVNGSNPIQTNTTISQENAVANKNSNSTNNKNAVATNGTKKGNNTTQNSLNTKNGDYTTTVADNTKNTTKNTTSIAANGTKTNSSTTQNSSNTKNGDYSTTVAQNTKNANATNSVKKGVSSSATAETNKTQETVHTTAVAQNETNNGTKTANSTNDANATKEVDATKEAIATTTEKKDEIKKSLLDVINDLHALEKDSTVVAEANPRRWTISPNASPVYYNSLVNGSPISETFADNTKSGDVNLSFGINVGYDVSKRLTIRTGIHKVDYSYSTKDVALVPTINTGTGTITTNDGIGANGISNEITTIAYSQNASTFSLTDRQVAINGEFTPTLLESSIRKAQIEGSLNQRMSYIEVPIELKYAVIDKKIGVNVIGGVSTLLLTENSIILDSPALTTELGEATNINDLSFSTNIGVGIDYKLSDQLEFNLEPMLKYQLNTFSGNTGNFKPYSVGVYTGVSFRF